MRNPPYGGFFFACYSVFQQSDNIISSRNIRQHSTSNRKKIHGTALCLPEYELHLPEPPTRLTRRLSGFAT
ncbi:Uncharacterised protein [Neisseria animalis]|nr:Uncharacterised protein [Neisseria animalis]